MRCDPSRAEQQWELVLPSCDVGVLIAQPTGIYNIPRRYPRCEAARRGTFLSVLMIGDKCSCLRAKPAHLVGHLPPTVKTAEKANVRASRVLIVTPKSPASERKTSDETAQAQTEADSSGLASSKVAKGHDHLARFAMVLAPLTA
jgi:hypothetical protein